MQKFIAVAAAMFGVFSAAAAQEAPSTVPPQAPAAAEPVHLVCEGDRRIEVSEESSAEIQHGWNVNNTSRGTITTTREGSRHGRIEVVIDGGTIRVDPTEILNSRVGILVDRPKDGFYVLTSPQVDDDHFSGVMNMSFIQKPTVKIDRHSGSIRISGGQMNFAGSCEKAASRSVQKF